MMITTLVIASGALATGVKVYRDKKREREYPWTVAAERLAKKDRALARKGFWPIGQGVSRRRPDATRVEGWYARPKSLIKRFKLSSKPASAEISAIEREIDRELLIVLGTLGLRVVGGYFSLLTLLSWPGQAYLALTYIRRASQEWQAERKIGVHAVDAVNAAALPSWS